MLSAEQGWLPEDRGIDWLHTDFDGLMEALGTPYASEDGPDGRAVAVYLMNRWGWAVEDPDDAYAALLIKKAESFLQLELLRLYPAERARFVFTDEDGRTFHLGMTAEAIEEILGETPVVQYIDSFLIPLRFPEQQIILYTVGGLVMGLEIGEPWRAVFDPETNDSFSSVYNREGCPTEAPRLPGEVAFLERNRLEKLSDGTYCYGVRDTYALLNHRLRGIL